MSSETPMGGGTAPPGRIIKSRIDFFAGLLLLGLAAVGYFGSLSLSAGQLSSMGPGMMPKITSVALVIFGAVLIGESLVFGGRDVDAWGWRGVIFVLGAALAFAATIRGLGLAVAGPLAIIISALADRETKLIEVAPYAIALTIFSALLFKWLLGLTIPIMPFLLDF